MKAKTQPKTKRIATKVQFGKVLVPVDFSKHSQPALDYAVKFAEQHGSRLVLLHVIEPIALPAFDAYPALATVQMAKENHVAVSKKLQELKATFSPRLQVETKISVGRPHIEITKAAQNLKADLIVITTHGHTGLKHILLGSTAEHVVRYSHCPVLTVRVK